MRCLTRFWAALDAIPGCAADGLSWREQLGDEWQSAARYLRPTGRMVGAVACPSPGGDGCPRTVVRLADERFRAVCGESPRRCDDLDLASTDVAVLALDRARLVRDVSLALDAPLDGTAAPRDPSLLHIGRHAVAAGISCPVVLLVPGPDPAQAEEMLRGTALGAEPGVVVVPTMATLPPNAQARLRTAGHTIIALADVLGIGVTGRLQIIQPIEVILEAPRARLLRRLKQPEAPLVWALPADARWGELTFRLTSDQELQCSFRGASRTLSPEGLRMYHSRSQKPDKNWLMMQMLAHGRGEAPIHDRTAEGAIRKRAQLLGDALSDAFGMSASPIQWDNKEHCYRAEFVISDERPLQVRRNFAASARRA